MTTTDAPHVKPCPFCSHASAPQIVRSNDMHQYCQDWSDDSDNFYAVMCDASEGVGCGASGGFKHTEAAAIETWNRRAAR